MIDKKEIAKKISSTHVNLDSDIELIQYITSNNEQDNNEPIKLLEVNSTTVSSGIIPVTIMPSTNIPLSSTIVEVTPMEYKQIINGNLKLPDGWSVAEIIYQKKD